jgi:hypothetical protein
MVAEKHELAARTKHPVRLADQAIGSHQIALVMLVGSMIPEATAKAGEKTGLAAVLGFAVAAGLSAIS